MNIYTLLFAVAAIIAAVFSYRQGYADGRSKEAVKKRETLRRIRTHKESNGARKARIEWENIENYGTDVPQQEVK